MEKQPLSERANEDAAGVSSDMERLFDASSFGSSQVCGAEDITPPRHLVVSIVDRVRRRLAVDANSYEKSGMCDCKHESVTLARFPEGYSTLPERSRLLLEDLLRSRFDIAQNKPTAAAAIKIFDTGISSCPDYDTQASIDSRRESGNRELATFYAWLARALLVLADCHDVQHRDSVVNQASSSLPLAVWPWDGADEFRSVARYTCVVDGDVMQGAARALLDRWRRGFGARASNESRPPVRRVLLGDYHDECGALMLAEIAVGRYCNAQALLDTVSHEQAYQASRSALDDIRSWVSQYRVVDSDALLVHIYKTASSALGAASRDYLFRMSSVVPEVPDGGSVVFRPRALKTFIRDLPEVERTVVILRAMIGMSVDAAAIIMETPAHAINSLQFRALSRLAKRVAGEVRGRRTVARTDAFDDEMIQLASTMADPGCKL